MLPAFPNREGHILKLVADGLTNREISRRLMISESTVENHIHHIYKKLKISNRAQAVGYVLRSRIIVPDDMMEAGSQAFQTPGATGNICIQC